MKNRVLRGWQEFKARKGRIESAKAKPSRTLTAINRGKLGVTQPGLFQRVSKLLGVQVGDIREWVGPLRGKVTVSARRVPGRGRVARNIERQNELYRQWHDAPDTDKPTIAKELFKEVLQHAQNLVWRRIPEEGKSSIAGDIASVVIEKLGEFRGEANAKFTTWAHQIVLNNINMELRKRVNSREKFIEYDEENPVLAIVGGKAPKSAIDHLEEQLLIHRIKREVSAQEYGLLECMLDGMSTSKIAAKFEITEDAAESRLRRLIENLKNKFHQSGGK